MSYDLYFFKKKENNISNNEIAEYLSTHLGANMEEQQQWYFENEDTEVYFSIELNENDSDSEDEDESDTMEDFDNTHFSFNLNFMRPGFFGLEAFKFVEQFCAELDLYVDNPQSGTEQPYKPDQKEQFDIWNKTNEWATKDLDTDMGFLYMDETITNRVWEYNFLRKQLQEKLSDKFFVPKIFFFVTNEEPKPFTIMVWTDHIPTVFPATDYVVLTRHYRKFFRKITDTAMISSATFQKIFGDYLVDMDSHDCKILHPDKAQQLKGKFYSVKTEKDLKTFASRLGVEKLTNVKI